MQETYINNIKLTDIVDDLHETASLIDALSDNLADGHYRITDQNSYNISNALAQLETNYRQILWACSENPAVQAESSSSAGQE